ncbi:RagB/SusD family nutrient uptake outer membrane protein [Dysgonomonas termitidis]|uniref:RagB/SusD family nutrient uptake outer membrane protein n=1 Tax=Dysgonomonas termitidis TaxID=1516126 RepID=A0ABV9KSH5_9BACT
MKRIFNKYIYVTIIAVIALSIVGCSDFLDRSPQGSFTEDDDTSGGLEANVFGVYSKMRSYNITAGIPAFAVHMFRSEDSEKGSTDNDGPDNARFWDDFEYTPSNGILGTYWNHNYSIIHDCNSVIDTLRKINNPEFNSLEAEAKFFRAYCYFNLVRAWGDVPLIDFKITDASQANIAKSPASAIYQLIDADLTYATANLPVSWEAKYVGRLTWGAARSLHARTYMMRNDWGNMLAASKEVIDSKIYNLNTAVDQVFTDAGENCGESIFELQCTATSAKPASTDIGSQFCQVQGVRGAGEWNLGWGWHMATSEVAKAFEPGDPRKDATLLYFRRPGEPITPENTNKPYGESPESSAMGAYFNKKAYTNPAMRAKYTREGFWVNIRIIRYPDVILMAAEAANETGNTDDALEYLEMVRAHARGASSSILPKVTTTDMVELRKAIQRERRAELALEPDRFYDLVRWGTATEVLHAAGKTNYQNKHALLPVPQSEIDKSNGVLKQNPDYL